MPTVTELTRRLALSAPLVQAPMAGVSTPALAAAASQAGILGSIGIGASNVEAARSMIDELRARTSRPFNVNVFCHRPAVRDEALERAWVQHLAPLFAEFDAKPPQALQEVYRSFIDDEQMFRLLLESRPAVVSFHFGLPRQEWLHELRNAGVVLFATATNVEEAERIERAGIDFIVAQGVEAGGHRGVFDPDANDPGLSTAALVNLLVPRTRIPVIAAGGIMDSRGIRAALTLGADAVQMGTAFILCDESSADAGFRAAMKSALAYDTRLTAVISGRRARGLANRFVVEAAVNAPPVAAYPVAYDAGKALNAAAKAKGSPEFGAHWAGQGAPLARAMPTADLVAELIRDL